MYSFLVFARVGPWFFHLGSTIFFCKFKFFFGKRRTFLRFWKKLNQFFKIKFNNSSILSVLCDFWIGLDNFFDIRSLIYYWEKILTAFKVWDFLLIGMNCVFFWNFVSCPWKFNVTRMHCVFHSFSSRLFGVNRFLFHFN